MQVRMLGSELGCYFRTSNTSERCDCLTRLCRSCRKRYTYYVIGQLVQIAQTLYNAIININVVDEWQEEDGCHVTFRLDFVNKEAGSVLIDNRCARTSVIARRLSAVSGVNFFKVPVNNNNNKKYVLSNSESVQCNFSFLITWRSSSSNLLLCTKFHENPMIFHRDMAIYRFLKWRPSAILELVYHHTRPPTKSLLLAAAACQISCQCHTQIWRYSYLNFSHTWLEVMPIQAPKGGFWGTLDL